MINKAREHLQAPELLYRHRYYRDAVSQAYYAVFTAMQAFIGDPPRGRWKHPALAGVFIRTLTERGLPIETCRQLRRRLRYLLDAREDADYREEEVEEGLAVDALEIAREVLSVVEEYG